MENALLEEHVRYGEARFRDKELVRPFVNRIYQDLAEIEEAMKHKTCSLCYWWNDFYTQCNDHDNALAGVDGYGCNRYEPKDNK